MQNAVARPIRKVWQNGHITRLPNDTPDVKPDAIGHKKKEWLNHADITYQTNSCQSPHLFYFYGTSFRVNISGEY